MNIKAKIQYLFAGLVFFGFSSAMAQQITTRASLDSINILIGDQIKLHLEVEQNNGAIVQFPQLRDSVASHIEIVQRLSTDTVKIDNNRLKIKQDYIVTSFDSGVHPIPPFVFTMKSSVGVDSFKSNALYLAVYTIPLDSIKGPIDIKKPYTAPVSLTEIAPWILLFLLVAGFLFLVTYAIMKREKVVKIFTKTEKPREPAHIIALRELEKLKEEKLWQNGSVKMYYSELTEIMRTYLFDRYKIPAMEQTASETIDAIQKSEVVIDETDNKNMVRILQTADLVKFAKYEPLPDENDLALVNSFSFVNHTKLEVVIAPVEPVAKEVDLNAKSLNN